MADCISDTTRAELKNAFDYYDANKTGLISSEDLLDFLNDVKFYPSKIEVEALIKEYSSGKNGLISFPEALEIVALKMFDENAEIELNQAFKSFDNEKKGNINAHELHEILIELHRDLPEEELAHILKDLKDEDGYIHYPSLIKEYLFA